VLNSACEKGTKFHHIAPSDQNTGKEAILAKMQVFAAMRWNYGHKKGVR